MALNVGWKIIYRQDESLVSPFASYKGRITFIPGTLATPKEGCGPISVYNNIYDAYGFIAKTLVYAGWSLWECRYELSAHRKMWVPSMGFLDADGNPLKSFKYPEECDVLADGVILTREIAKAIIPEE